MTLTDERPDKSSQRRNSVEVVTASNYRLDRLTFPFHVFFSFPFLFFLFLFFRHASSTTAFNNNIREFLSKRWQLSFFLLQIVHLTRTSVPLSKVLFFIFYSLSLFGNFSSYFSFSLHRFILNTELKFQLWIFWILGTTSYACSNWTICSFNFP